MRRTKQLIRVGAILVVLGLGLAAPAAAQTMFADWTGVVSYPSGGAIPKATVTLIKEDTMAKRTTTTDATGTYRVDGVMLGSYTIEVETGGFKKHVQTTRHLPRY